MVASSHGSSMIARQRDLERRDRMLVEQDRILAEQRERIVDLVEQADDLARRLARVEADPHLGLATNRQLLEELAARFRITTPFSEGEAHILRILSMLNGEELAYRTVDL